MLSRRYALQIDESKGLIFDFFIVYSRYEYVLKEMNFYRVNNGRWVSPDWKKYASRIENKLNLGDHNLKDAINYYLHQPPKIQIEKDGLLIWGKNKQHKNEKDIEWVFRSIGITRNNLFHGGKFPFDQIRDTKLLLFGLVILYACLEADKEFNEKFLFGGLYRFKEE